MLRTREGDVERGIPIDPKVGLVTFHEAAEDMLNDYEAQRTYDRNAEKPMANRAGRSSDYR
jgi:hypothetical protein